jgi:hypothetical protein
MDAWDESRLLEVCIEVFFGLLNVVVEIWAGM